MLGVEPLAGAGLVQFIACLIMAFVSLGLAFDVVRFFRKESLIGLHRIDLGDPMIDARQFAHITAVRNDPLLVNRQEMRGQDPESAGSGQLQVESESRPADGACESHVADGRQRRRGAPSRAAQPSRSRRARRGHGSSVRSARFQRADIDRPQVLGVDRRDRRRSQG